MAIARLHDAKTRREWALYWRHRNLKFHLYDRVDPSADVATLLDAIERDPTCLPWG